MDISVGNRTSGIIGLVFGGLKNSQLLPAQRARSWGYYYAAQPTSDNFPGIQGLLVLLVVQHNGLDVPAQFEGTLLQVMHKLDLCPKVAMFCDIITPRELVRQMCEANALGMVSHFPHITLCIHVFGCYLLPSPYGEVHLGDHRTSSLHMTWVTSSPSKLVNTVLQFPSEAIQGTLHLYIVLLNNWPMDALYKGCSLQCSMPSEAIPQDLAIFFLFLELLKKHDNVVYGVSTGQLGVVAHHMEHFIYSLKCIICFNPGSRIVLDSNGGVSTIMLLVPITWQQAMAMFSQAICCIWEGDFTTKCLEIALAHWELEYRFMNIMVCLYSYMLYRHLIHNLKDTILLRYYLISLGGLHSIHLDGMLVRDTNISQSNSRGVFQLHVGRFGCAQNRIFMSRSRLSDAQLSSSVIGHIAWPFHFLLLQIISSVAQIIRVMFSVLFQYSQCFAEWQAQFTHYFDTSSDVIDCTKLFADCLAYRIVLPTHLWLTACLDNVLIVHTIVGFPAARKAWVLNATQVQPCFELQPMMVRHRSLGPNSLLWVQAYILTSASWILYSSFANTEAVKAPPQQAIVPGALMLVHCQCNSFVGRIRGSSLSSIVLGNTSVTGDTHQTARRFCQYKVSSFAIIVVSDIGHAWTDTSMFPVLNWVHHCITQILKLLCNSPSDHQYHLNPAAVVLLSNGLDNIIDKKNLNYCILGGSISIGTVDEVHTIGVQFCVMLCYVNVPIRMKQPWSAPVFALSLSGTTSSLNFFFRWPASVLSRKYNKCFQWKRPTDLSSCRLTVQYWVSSFYTWLASMVVIPSPQQLNQYGFPTMSPSVLSSSSQLVGNSVLYWVSETEFLFPGVALPPLVTFMATSQAMPVDEAAVLALASHQMDLVVLNASYVNNLCFSEVRERHVTSSSASNSRTKNLVMTVWCLAVLCSKVNTTFSNSCPKMHCHQRNRRNQVQGLFYGDPCKLVGYRLCYTARN